MAPLASQSLGRLEIDEERSVHRSYQQGALISRKIRTIGMRASLTSGVREVCAACSCRYYMASMRGSVRDPRMTTRPDHSQVHATRAPGVRWGHCSLV